MRVLKLLSVFFLVLFFTVPAFAADPTGAALLEVLHNKGVVDDASYNEIKKAGAEGGDTAMSRKLLDVLHDKGVLDDATYSKLVAQSDAEARAQTAVAAAPVTTAPQATPVPGGADRPLDKAFSAVEEGFARLGGDTVKLKIGAFLQVGWLNDDAGFSVGIPPASNRSTTSGNQFFVRRARLFFDTMLTDKAGFRISMEAADPAGRILRDAYFFADYIPYTRVTIGQQKVPFGVEGSEALASNPTVNRSFATNFIHAPTLRDLGVTLSGQYKTKVGGLPLGAGYAVGVSNGPGMNTTDDNDYKDVAGRVWVNPFVAGLTVGGSLYKGVTNTVSFDPGGDPSKDKATDRIKRDWDRWAAEAEYRPAYIKGLLLRGEYLWARKYYAKYASKDITSTTDTLASPMPRFDRQAHSSGWYVLAAYRVDGLQGYWRYLNGIEPVVRYDYFDEDTSTVDALARQDSRTRTTVGLNYYLNKYTRVMANYEIIHADAGLKTSSLETIDTIGHHLFTTVFQVKF